MAEIRNFRRILAEFGPNLNISSGLVSGLTLSINLAELWCVNPNLAKDGILGDEGRNKTPPTEIPIIK